MRFFKYFSFLLVLIGFSSCKLLRPNLMLKTPKDYTYDKIVDSLSKQDYKIDFNDIVNVRIFSNDGFKIVDLANSAQNARFIELDYVVNRDGTAKLPLVGRVKLAGLSVREATEYLEQIYADYYVKPFVYLTITNKRVIVFPGNGGAAKVLNLVNNNTTVIEALALTGGISDDGKAYKVKLIRNQDNQPPKVYLMDLSKIEGIAVGNTVVLAHDIIYVEPRYRFARTLVSEITPIVSLISTTFLLYTLTQRIR
ncbi:MAG: polysaccharide export protein Wza [Bacteroidetes bacterium]|nr:polysaccharide export protein Wza [Bacteroidota bacterium]MDF2451155.1 polysaccharide export protein Wza [Bacteroidota bacterium]